MFIIFSKIKTRGLSHEDVAKGAPCRCFDTFYSVGEGGNHVVVLNTVAVGDLHLSKKNRFAEGKETSVRLCD